jgi:hypothetical protein
MVDESCSYCLKANLNVPHSVYGRYRNVGEQVDFQLIISVLQNSTTNFPFTNTV